MAALAGRGNATGLRPGHILALSGTMLLHGVLLGLLWLIRPAPADLQRPAAEPRAELVDFELLPPPPPPPAAPQELRRQQLAVRPEPRPIAPPPPVPEPTTQQDALPTEQSVAVDPQPMPQPSPQPADAEMGGHSVAIATPPVLRAGIDYHCRALSYPRGPQARGEQGTVLLDLRLTPRGTLSGVSVAQGSGWRGLDQAALRWARRCSFSPPALPAGAVEARALLPVRFALDD